jgi:hypothetical protein
MLHVILVTAVSAMAAFSPDSVRQAAKAGTVRPDSSLITLPTPAIKAPDAPAPKIAPMVTLAWPTKKVVVATAADAKTVVPSSAPQASKQAESPKPADVVAKPAEATKPEDVAKPVDVAAKPAEIVKPADDALRTVSVLQQAAAKSPPLGVAIAAADASAVARTVLPTAPKAPERTADGRIVNGTRTTISVEPLHAVPIPAAGVADSMVVYKHERTLTLYKSGVPLRSYFVALGGNPVGDKLRAGDQRTPEGLFYINAHNPASKFHLALRISYPDAVHRARSASLGFEPGGDIMIHGLSPEYSEAGKAQRTNDWTNGCVALSNPEIEEIWSAVPDGTPIEIKP